uniref:Uncharacterized protein n=1 Tax=Pristionchus pacificus TaxID=54126 RepID=A0A2A6B7T3_PRIPA|eukprot:PDM61942.1 hypothetical protein PRIPAC_51384 [Pristionchus pacificus]
MIIIQNRQIGTITVEMRGGLIPPPIRGEASSGLFIPLMNQNEKRKNFLVEEEETLIPIVEDDDEFQRMMDDDLDYRANTQPSN